MPGKSEVEVTEGTTVAPRMVDRFSQYLLDRADRENGDGADPADVTASLTERILSAQTEDEIWDADEGATVRLDSFIGCELEFKPGWRPIRSKNEDFKSAFGAFIIGQAVIIASSRNDYKPGEQVTYNTGAAGVIAKLRAFEALELLPKKALVKGVETNSGNTVLKLARPARRAS